MYSLKEFQCNKPCRTRTFFSCMLKDPILTQLIKEYPPPNFTDRSEFLYQDLIESIVSQQLSIKAADTIFGRFTALFDENFPRPEQILTKSDEQLRAVGMSYQKASYIKAIATAFLKKEINTKKIQQMPDEDVIVELTKIRGVGKWTAEMILIFTLKRPDIFSLGDLGLRNAITNLYGITDPKEMLTLSATWSPHRSTASWYLWRSLENKKI